ncbi:MAG TPA: SDR family NAD(P)-dependent oxidoreductase [Acidimicrobiia bacterium]|jgi:NAD(P)-dependent dehydrogenase (short-subunit alcohol dehydrogenase family)
MAYDFNGKRVLVTGASAGIGEALAMGFAERGATVGICARRADRLAAVVEKLQKHSPASTSWTIDLADLDAVDGLAADVLQEFGGLDVLVNNAGIPKRRSVINLEATTIDSVNLINYLSPIHLTLALLPALIESSGEVINISSVAARLSPPAEAAYAATKAAITAFSESMYVDLAIAGDDVGVHVVNPGVFDTELFTLPDNDDFTAPVDMLPVSDIVEPVLSLLGTDIFERYVPEWFGDVVGAKFPDTTKYLQGNIAWVKSQQS